MSQYEHNDVFDIDDEKQYEDFEFDIFSESGIQAQNTNPTNKSSDLNESSIKIHEIIKTNTKKAKKKIEKEFVPGNPAKTLFDQMKSHNICFCSRCGRLIHNEEYKSITFEQFIEYLNFKINGDKNKKIPKNTLYVLFSQLQYFLNLGTLTREDKRGKNKIYSRLYEESTNVMFCLENMPHLFVDPVLLYMKSKMNMKKSAKKSEN